MIPTRATNPQQSVLLLESRASSRNALTEHINRTHDLAVSSSHATIAEAKNHLHVTTPDIAVVASRLADGTALEFLTYLRTARLDLPAIVLGAGGGPRPMSFWPPEPSLTSTNKSTTSNLRTSSEFILPLPQILHSDAIPMESGVFGLSTSRALRCFVLQHVKTALLNICSWDRSRPARPGLPSGARISP